MKDFDRSNATSQELVAYGAKVRFERDRKIEFRTIALQAATDLNAHSGDISKTLDAADRMYGWLIKILDNG